MRSAHFQISFADLEFKKQGVELEPVLAEIADFIDEYDELVEAVRRDLNRGLKKPVPKDVPKFPNRKRAARRRMQRPRCVPRVRSQQFADWVRPRQ